MLGSVNTAVGRISPEAILRQPFALLLLGAAAEDQLGRDLGAGAERSDADIAARQLLGDDAHRFLAEPEAAYSSGMVRPNTPSSAICAITSSGM